ncbi:MAG: NAD(P)-dependent oxidoreductase [Methylococcaceae bacterium]|nr:NAD(P)-dependent oxidoreductase [Methylococcaceae bacterium]
MKTIAITGTSGFIGKHLVAELLRLGNFRIKLLSRNRNRDFNDLIGSGVQIEITEGDLLEPTSLHGFLEQGCTVVNLVYLRDAGEADNITAVTNLLEACKSANVRRLVHCSTAEVVGRVNDNLVTESTLCRPITQYGMTKIKIENAILAAAKAHFDIVLLRPTAVFGPGGMNLEKLTNDLITKNWLKNYIKSCLFDRRRMNLVSIANVVAAIIFLINRTEIFNGEIFIVSDDNNPANNFADVERILMKALNCPDYFLPRIPVPQSVLRLLLRLLGRNNINPGCNYSQAKLENLGFNAPVKFEAGLLEYANWYRSKLFVGQRGDTN